MAAPPQALPEDIILTEILKRLPVKYVLRFRCVCKLWKCLFSEPYFVESHLNCTAQNPNDENFIINTSITTHLNRHYDENLISILSLFNLSETRLCKAPYPNQLIDLIGSINGLVCVFLEKLYQFVVWNPAIRQAKTIYPPVKKSRLYSDSKRLTGFCWDAVENDFKVVFTSKLEGTLSQSYVYSCNYDYWTKIPVFSFPPSEHCQLLPQIVNGVSYWTFTRSCEEKLIYAPFKFEVGSNEFRSLPEFESGESSLKGFLIVNLKECISALVYMQGDCLVDVYCLDERCGVWCKMYNVGPITGVCVDRLFHRYKYGGEIVFETGEKFMCYDPKTYQIRGLVRREGQRIKGELINCFPYKASLVFLQGMKPLHLANPIF